jgi:hypothetical protein
MLFESDDHDWSSESIPFSTTPQASPQISEFRSSPPIYVIIVDIYFPYHASTHYPPHNMSLTQVTKGDMPYQVRSLVRIPPLPVFPPSHPPIAAPRARVVYTLEDHDEARAHKSDTTHTSDQALLTHNNSIDHCYGKADSSPPTTSANMPNGERAMLSAMRRVRRKRGKYRSLFKRD